MANTNDPITGLLGIMQRGTSQGFMPCIGSVISVNPLRVQASGLMLEGDELLVNDMLLSGYDRSATLGEEAGTMTWTNRGLAVGNKVLLIPEPASAAGTTTFYLICVVKAVST